jgi:hypothetical protein
MSPGLNFPTFKVDIRVTGGHDEDIYGTTADGLPISVGKQNIEIKV